MGGFVSGPAVVAAEEIGVPVALVNLDAVPGKANRKLARKASQVFSAYRTQSLRAATPIGLPLRRAAVGDKGKAEARLALGIDANRPTLVVIGGSQGAQSMNRMMIKLSHKARFVEAMRGWQILHVCGPGNEEEMLQGYEGCDINVSVMGFCDRVGLAWSAATIAISRAGAGSVAEAWSNATPTIFLPYPYHRDQHQRLNAMPLCNIGGALLMEDQIDPALNSREIIGVLRGLTENPGRCEAMVKTMHSSHPADGADAIAQWVADRLMSPAVAEPVRQVA